MRVSLGRSVAPLAFGLVLVGGLAGCGGATTSITGSTPAPSPTTSTDRQAASAISCADGGLCVVGDIGPGTGRVFYVSTTPQAWGTYLEVAPAKWHGEAQDPKAVWCDNGKSGAIGAAQGLTIGSGFKNTGAMVDACSSPAAKLAKAYTGGGKTDWFLPSRDELKELYAKKTSASELGTDLYWSSSQLEKMWTHAIYVAFTGGALGQDMLQAAHGVRPVRAF